MMKLGLKGEYQLQVLDKDGNVKQDTGWFPNAILDNFFTGLRDSTTISNRPDPFNPNTGFSRIEVGTGSTAVAFNQTALANRLTGMAITSQVNQSAVTVNGNNWEISGTKTANFTLGSVVGVITEVGCSFCGGGGGGQLIASPLVHSRALVTDINGNPTSITVTNQDQLIVRYKMTLKGTDTDGTGTITLNGNVYNWIGRRALLDSPSRPFQQLNFRGMVGGTFNGAGAAASGGTTFSAKETTVVNSGVLGRVVNRMYYESTEGVGNISIFQINETFNTQMFKFQFTPAIPKLNTQILSLDFGFEFTRA